VQPEDGVQPIERGALVGVVHVVGRPVVDVGQELSEPADPVGDPGVCAAHRGGGTIAQ
jgi:hypothetical protein